MTDSIKVYKKEIEQTKKFIEFAEEVLNKEEYDIEDTKRIYQFKESKTLRNLFIELEYVLLQKAKKNFQAQLDLKHIQLRVKRYKTLNKLYVLYKEEVIGTISIENKEFFLFNPKKEKEFLKSDWKSRNKRTIIHLNKEIKKIEREKEKWFLNWFRNTKDFETNILKHKKQISLCQSNIDVTNEKFEEEEKREVIQNLIVYLTEVGLKCVKDSEWRCVRIYNLYGGKDHLEYVKSLEHYKFTKLFGCGMDFAKHFFIREEVKVEEKHCDHANRLMTIPYKLIGHMRDENIEVIYTKVEKVGQEEDEEFVDERFLYHTIEKEDIFGHDYQLLKVVFKYKGEVFILRWDGLLFTSHNGEEILIEESKAKEKKEKE